MPDQPNIHTGGGSAVSGNVNTGGGDFVGRDQINIIRPLSREDIQNRRNLAVLRKAVRSFWIDGVLKHSLYQEALIRLNMQERSNAVDNRPWNLIAQTDGEADQELPPGARIVDVFDRMDQLMLILGEPGSGKTTTILELARDLTDRAERDPALPMPVVFNLSSWALRKAPLAEWLVDELKTRYSIPKDVAQAWVKQNDLLPLLDGLDEVQEEYRVACAHAINAFRQEHIVPLAVCSRVAEYERLNMHLKLQGAIQLQPLNAEQTAAYLNAAGGQLSGLRAALGQDPELQQLAESPLLLSIMVLAYQGQSVSEVSTTDATQTRRQHLFDTYIKRVFVRREMKPLFSPLKTIRWLQWLATRLIRYGQTTFLVERMQPDWIQPGNRESKLVFALMALWGLVYGLSFGVALGLMGGLIGELIGAQGFMLQIGLPLGLILGSGSGLLLGLLDGLSGGFREIRQIDPSGKIKIWRRVKSGLYGIVVHGLAGGVLGGLFFALLFVVAGTVGMITAAKSPSVLDSVLLVAVALLAGTAGGVGVGFYFGLLGALSYSLSGRQREIVLSRRPKVNLRSGLTSGLPVGLASALFFGLGAALAERLDVLVIGLLPVLICGLGGGILDELIGAPSAEPAGQTDVPTQSIVQKPNQTIRSAARRTILWGLNSATVGALIVGLFAAAVMRDELVSLLTTALFYALVVGQIGGLLGSADVFLKHYILRFALWLKGAMPLRYVRFLDYAASLIFLRKVGGGYIFIHRLIMEHFAAMTDKDIERIVAGIPGYGRK